MGNIETIESNERRHRIFSKKNLERLQRNSRTPPRYHAKNQLYICPKDINSVIRYQKKDHSPYSQSRFRYANHSPQIYRQTNLNSLHKSFIQQPSYKNNIHQCFQPINASANRIYEKNISRDFNNTISSQQNFQDTYRPLSKSVIINSKRIQPKSRVMFCKPIDRGCRKNHMQRLSPQNYENYENCYPNGLPYSPIKRQQNCVLCQQSNQFEQNRHKFPILTATGLKKAKPVHYDQDNTPTERKGHSWQNQDLLLSSHEIYEESRDKCHDIIKKVRNFNDFLNEIKKKVQFQQQNYRKQQRQDLFEQQTNRQKKRDNPPTFNQSHNTSQNNESRQISMILKLENEKIQLQKYRKLIQRELSKQQSIQSISIEENGNKKQKIIKIHYDLPTSKNQDKFIKQQPNISTANQKKQLEKTRPKFTRYTDDNKNINKNAPIQELRQQYYDISCQLNTLGQIIRKKQYAQSSESSEEAERQVNRIINMPKKNDQKYFMKNNDQKKQNDIKQRVSNINTLIQNMQQYSEKDTYQYLKEALLAKNINNQSQCELSSNKSSLEQLN